MGQGNMTGFAAMANNNNNHHKQPPPRRRRRFLAGLRALTRRRLMCLCENNSLKCTGWIIRADGPAVAFGNHAACNGIVLDDDALSTANTSMQALSIYP